MISMRRIITQTRLLPAVLLCGLILFCARATAVGIGDLALDSQLGQPLQMSIALDNIGNLADGELYVALASAERYRAMGLDRPAYHGRMKLDVRLDSNGGATIFISTHRPVNEPYVAFVLEVPWPKGNVFREFTVLLDPTG